MFHKFETRIIYIFILIHVVLPDCRENQHDRIIEEA